MCLCGSFVVSVPSPAAERIVCLHGSFVVSVPSPAVERVVCLRGSFVVSVPSPAVECVVCLRGLFVVFVLSPAVLCVSVGFRGRSSFVHSLFPFKLGLFVLILTASVACLIPGSSGYFPKISNFRGGIDPPCRSHA